MDAFGNATFNIRNYPKRVRWPSESRGGGEGTSRRHESPRNEIESFHKQVRELTDHGETKKK